jgi:hypothetical protein
MTLTLTIGRYASPAYGEILALRTEHATSTAFIIDAVVATTRRQRYLNELARPDGDASQRESAARRVPTGVGAVLGGLLRYPVCQALRSRQPPTRVASCQVEPKCDALTAERGIVMRTIVGKGAIITGGTSGIGARAAGCVSRRQERGFVAPLAINASEVLRGEKRRLIEFDQPASRLFEAGWHCVKPTPFS